VSLLLSGATGSLVAPLVESRPAAQLWSVAPLLRPNPAQPSLDLRLPDDPLVLGPPAELADGCAADLVEVRGWSAALAVAVFEVVTRRRPATQLSRWVTEEVLTTLASRLPGRRDGARSYPPPALRSVRLQFPRSGVAEVSVHGRIGSRSVPLALRLEAGEKHWLCTALELGPLP